MNFTKIFGWVLLIVGVIIIGWTLYSSYNIFSGKVTAPEIFEMQKEEVKVLSSKEKISGIQDIQVQLEEMIAEQLKGILPVDTIPKMLNLIAWSILAGILIFGGSQISNIGVKIIEK